MPPNSEKIADNEIFNGPIPDHKVSYPELKYPSIRIMKKPVPDMWIKGKRLDDNAEGLWRVNNKLYDLSEFIEKHPGGKFWLETSQVSLNNKYYHRTYILFNLTESSVTY